MSFLRISLFLHLFMNLNEDFSQWSRIKITSYEIHKASVCASVAHLSPAITMMEAMSFLGFPCMYNNVFSLFWNSSWYGMACLQMFPEILKHLHLCPNHNSKNMGHNK